MNKAAQSEAERVRPGAIGNFLQKAASGGAPFWSAVLIIVFVALCLRLPSLESRSLWLDEAYSAFFIRESFEALWSVVPLYETHPPFFYTLLKLWSLAFGDSEAGLRSLSVVAGLATLGLVAWRGHVAVLGGPTTVPVLAALLYLATNQDMVRRAQDARPYALQTLTATIAILAAISLLRRFKSEGWTRRELVPDLAALALGGGVTLWLHNTSFFICLGIWGGLVAAIWMQGASHRLEKLALAAASGGIALAIWLPYLPMYLTQAKMMTAIPFWQEAEIKDAWQAWLMIAGSYSTLGALAILIVLGLHNVAHAHYPQAAFIAIVLVLPLGAVLLINFAIKPIFIDRLFAWMTPLVALVAAQGLVALWRGRKTLAIGLGVILLLGNLATTMRWHAYTPEPWREMIDMIADQQAPGDQIVAIPNELTAPISYYASRQDHFPPVAYVPGPFPVIDPSRRYITNLGSPIVEPKDAVRLAGQMTGAKRIWVLSRNLDLFDTDRAVAQTIEQNLKEVFFMEKNGLVLQRYE